MLWVSLESTRARRDRRHTKKAYSAAMVITTLATDERTMAAMSSLRRWWCLSTTITPATTPQSKMMNTATRFIRPSQKDECFGTKLNWVKLEFQRWHGSLNSKIKNRYFLQFELNATIILTAVNCFLLEVIAA